MEFWEDIGKRISNAASSAADYTVKETEKLTNIAKAKYKLSNLKSRMDSLYRQVGVLRYGEYIGDPAQGVLYEDLFRQISETSGEIERLETLIAKLRNDNICANCGAKLSKDMIFCPKCGTKQPERDNTQASEDDEEPMSI